LQRTLETITIIVSATQLLCTGVIHVGISEVVPPRIGRVWVSVWVQLSFTNFSAQLTAMLFLM